MCRIFKSFPICIFFCCSIFLRVLSVSVFSLASRCPQFSVLYLGVPQDWVSLSLYTECFHFGAFYVACGILWPKETFLWQQIRARLHQETSVTPSAELNCDHTTDQDSKIFPEQKLSPKKISSQFLALLCMVGKLASEQTHCLDLQFSCEAAHALILFNLEILSRLQCINDHCNLH